MNHRSDSSPKNAHAGPDEAAVRADGRVRHPTLPDPVSRLLRASGEKARNDAWSDYLGHYSRLLLKVARRASTGHDETMDRYAFILDQLRRDDFRRLRTFAAEGRGRFTTWLVVVARRLCVDHHRRTHGRPQSAGDSRGNPSVEQVARRNLAALVADEIDLEQLEDHRSPRPDASVLETERHEALAQALTTLDAADQLLLTLRFVDEQPMARIGPLLGLESRFQVHRRLRNILERLRSELRERGFTAP